MKNSLVNEQLVLASVEKMPGSTMKNIRETTAISRRTLYATVKRLVELKKITAKDSIRDTRQRHYYITPFATFGVQK